MVGVVVPCDGEIAALVLDCPKLALGLKQDFNALLSRIFSERAINNAKTTMLRMDFACVGLALRVCPKSL